MEGKRLLLVNPRYERGVSGAPLSLLYLAGGLKDTNVDVKLLDMNITDDQKKFVEALEEYRPTHVGVTSYSPNRIEALDVLKTVKYFDSTIKTISGGVHETAIGRYGRDYDFIDFRSTSEFGENELRRILGVGGMTDRNKILPSYEMLGKNPKYQFASDIFGERLMTQALTSTGCNEKCTFCGAKEKYKSLENPDVIRLIGSIINLGYGAMFFNDPNFTAPNPHMGSDKYGRISGLMNDFMETGISSEIIWGCQTKSTMVNQDLLDNMADAGCVYICYSLDCVDDATLRETRKGVMPEDVRKSIEWSKERGISVGLYSMIGTAKSLSEDSERTKKVLGFVEETRPDYLSLSILANYPMIDRLSGKPINMELDYDGNGYSRDDIWLEFDEGWGAYHPYCNAERAKIYLNEIESRMDKTPDVWRNIKRF